MERQEAASAQTMQAKLLAILRQTQVDLQRFADGLTDEERAAIGDASHWSAKDHLAHMTYHTQRLNETFIAVRDGTEVPVEDEDVQRRNERIFTEWRDRPWGEVMAEMLRAYVQLSANVANCPEDVLLDAERTPQVVNGPLFDRVMGDALWHLSEHYVQFYLEHGKLAQAAAIYERNIATARAIFGESQELGNALYNQGCFCARTGQPEAAIEAVRQSFSLSPDLIELSRQDSDLDSLRALPAFQALYA